MERGTHTLKEMDTFVNRTVSPSRNVGTKNPRLQTIPLTVGNNAITDHCWSAALVGQHQHIGGGNAQRLSMNTCVYATLIIEYDPLSANWSVVSLGNRLQLEDKHRRCGFSRLCDLADTQARSRGYESGVESR